jgi:outer membrane protein insertion porin family
VTTSRALALVLTALALCPSAWAQDAPLFLVNDSTQIDRRTFTFTDGEGTFSEGELVDGALLATREPSTCERYFSWTFFCSSPDIPLDPVQVQKDVARLRDFYAQRGFPQASVYYGGSKLDTASNEIELVFEITEGPPLVVRSQAFRTADGRSLARFFADDLAGVSGAERWPAYRDDLPTQPGERFSTFDFALTKGAVLDFVRDRGFAFASLRADSTLYDDLRRIDLTLTVDPGPRAIVDTIQVVGNRSVADHVARRELPLQLGDYFSQGRLLRGQRNLFSLPLFSVAVGSVPDQAEDSTVTVRYEVREAAPRLLRAQTGYSREEGIVLQPSFEHRNFLGGARSLNLAAEWRTTLLASAAGGFKPVRRFEVQATFTQPYVFHRDFSGIVAPFYRFEDNDNLGIGYREFGQTTTLIYEILPFRTANVRYLFANVLPLSLRDAVSRDAFNRSVLSANATLGDVDDFFQPEEGTLYRPGLELATGLLGSGVEYAKAELNVLHYRRLTPQIQGGLRLYGGYILPFGESRDQNDPVTEYRFDLIRFQAGGSSDVRGWGLGQLGPKQILADSVALAAPPTNAIPPPGQPLSIENFDYEPVGGTTKLALNAEIRTPFPGLSETWRAAFFVDGAYIDAGKQSVRGLYDAQQLRIGTGVGVRYQTPIGFIRADLGFKLNPAESDVYSAEDLYAKRFLGEDVSPSLWRRFQLHLSIGQAF